MKIGIISDTHGMLRPEVTDALKGCDFILHGGDIDREEILDRLSFIAPVYAVRGNNDWSWASRIPYVLDFNAGGLHICMAHRKYDLPGDLSKYDLVVFGHSHEYEEYVQGKTLILNPGSCGPRRFRRPVTMATAEVSDGTITVTRIDIPTSQPELRNEW